MPASIIISEPHTPANILRQIRPYDSNLDGNPLTSGSNFSLLREYCDQGFDPNISVINLFDRQFPLDLADVQWDFELGQGTRSLARRGFYNIIEAPSEITVGTIPTWCAKVLYHASIDHPSIYKFYARIGPLLNQQALGFDFSPSGPNFIRGVTPTLKQAYFMSMIDKPFYVSQQRRLPTSGNTYEPKETLWIKFL